eukprot:scaffold33445_cov39-Tisochrysis_lutea.AAC.2
MLLLPKLLTWLILQLAGWLWRSVVGAVEPRQELQSIRAEQGVCPPISVRCFKNSAAMAG